MAFRDHEPIIPTVTHGKTGAELRQVPRHWYTNQEEYLKRLQKVADWSGATVIGTSSLLTSDWKLQIEDQEGNVHTLEQCSWVAITSSDDLILANSYREAYHRIRTIDLNREGRIIKSEDLADLLNALRLESKRIPLGAVAAPLQKIRDSLGLSPLMNTDQILASIKNVEIK